MNTTLYIDAWGPYFRNILSRGWVDQISKNCGADAFLETVVCVNWIHTDDIEICDNLIDSRLREKSIDRIIRTPVVHSMSLDRYDIKLDDLGFLPYASLADFVAIDDCKTKYIAMFCGDCCPWGSSEWIKEGIEILIHNPDFMIVNPTWNGFCDHARAESDGETPEYFIGRGFSDQCYLARSDDLKANIYQENNPESDLIYCPAHGNTFEKRVNAYMRNHGKKRITLKNSAYLTRP